jgi:XRE family transcriptional regulator, regulator of sulfur utilization
MKKFDFSVLKTLRLKRGLTAEQLSEKANVTRATIAKMETGFDNPTVQTVESLAKVFQLSTSDLVRLSEGVRLEHARIEDFSRPGYSAKRIYFNNFEIYHVKAKKGAFIESDYDLHEDTAEICFVLSGHLILTIGNQDVLMESGMVVRFGAMHEHRIDFREDTELLFIHHNIV